MLAASLLLIGSLKTCFGVIQPFLEVGRARSWVHVPLTSGRASVGRFHGEYYVKVDYTYEFAGRMLTGGRYAFLPLTSFLPEQKLLALQNHSPSACYVNPSSPSESVIERTLPWQAYSWTGLLCLSCGAFALLWLRGSAKAG